MLEFSKLSVLSNRTELRWGLVALSARKASSVKKYTVGNIAWYKVTKQEDFIIFSAILSCLPVASLTTAVVTAVLGHHKGKRCLGCSPQVAASNTPTSSQIVQLMPGDYREALRMVAGRGRQERIMARDGSAWERSRKSWKCTGAQPTLLPRLC